MPRPSSLNSKILIGCLIGIAGGLLLGTPGASAVAGSTLYGAKLLKNAEKYPVEKARGSRAKYTEL